ncbi:hypothetical protein [Rodentibacter ratti]|uniref:hypothetical protein n=1 Tax=Rodentibacter ratti TaxID=1906745 RepID=UPI0015D662CC|nr:hypothetical protein [Rodentibacter ratti]
MARRIYPPHQCGSDHDYYDQFDEPQGKPEPDIYDWKDDNDYNGEVIWEVQQ